MILAEEDDPLPEIPALIRAPRWKRPWLWDQFCLPYLLLYHGVRVFHNFTTLGPLPQVSFPSWYGFRSIATVHDWHMFGDDASEVEKFYRRTLRIRLQLRALPRARHVVVDSEHVKRETQERSGVDPRRMIVLPLGADHLDSAPEESWYMENFALSVGDTPNKNLGFALKVLERMRGKYVHLNWVIVGGRKPILEQLGIAGSAAPSWITILGAPTDSRLKSCYQKALCLLFPSTREGFGIPVLEAMRLGCPVLASNISPMKNLLDHGPALRRLGDREDWCEALSALLFSPEAREASIEAGRRRAELFTWSAAAEAARALYSR